MKSAAESPKLLDCVRPTLRARHYSRRTEEAYVAWILRFILFHGKRHPSTMSGDEVNRSLKHLAAECKVAASTQNQTLCALLFLYGPVLDQMLDWVESAIHAKRPERLPVVLTREEVKSICHNRFKKRYGAIWFRFRNWMKGTCPKAPGGLFYGMLWSANIRRPTGNGLGMSACRSCGQ